MAGYVLQAEQRELGIAAGLQDRVAQAYDRPVFMNFTPEAFAANHNRHGIYEALPEGASQFFKNRLFLLFPRPKADELEDGKSSGKVHSPIRKKWEDGDIFTRGIMREIGELAEKGRVAVTQGDEPEFIRLMNENFALRLKLFGDAVSPADRELVSLARSFGKDVGANLPGSGGAVLVFSSRGDAFENFIRAEDKANIIRLRLR
jgi:glucuronokinase